jgi:hypothetical protein
VCDTKAAVILKSGAWLSLYVACISFPGVWDDVGECKDELSFVHDEMKSLLKEKVVLEAKLDEQVGLMGHTTGHHIAV